MRTRDAASSAVVALALGAALAAASAAGSSLGVGTARAQERGGSAGSVASAGGAGAAGEVVPAEVIVVLAAEAEGTIDPTLADITALRQPPFNAFHSMSVLSRSMARLSVDRPMQVSLPNGRQLRIELERATDDGRYRVRVSINTPGRTDYLPLLSIVASPGEPFFVAGQNWQGGTLVIGVRIGQPPATRATRRKTA